MLNPPAPPPTRAERVGQAVSRQARVTTQTLRYHRDLVIATIFLVMGFLMGKL